MHNTQTFPAAITMETDFQPTLIPTPKSQPKSKASISVCGLGYVGIVTTGCLSDLGHTVIGVDTDRRKLKYVGSGKSPISEPGLEALLEAGVAQEKISVSVSLMRAVWETDVTFISVGTPTSEDGGCDMSAVINVSTQIGIALSAKTDFHVIVMRCSVPAGTTLDLMRKILESESGKTMGVDFGLSFNPEFLREGTAIEDFHEPPKTVIGASDDRTAKILAEIYAPIDDSPILTSIPVAEMIKYVDNVWYATKVTFANEVGRLCKPMKIDSHAVMDAFVQDTKLNLSPYYLKPGFAFGGSCLPKEVRAVEHMARDLGVVCPLIESLNLSNWMQIEQAIDMTVALQPKAVAVLGVAFKPNTDDLRESPVLPLIHYLFQNDILVQAYDPCVVTDEKLQGQFEYIKHAQPELKHLIDNLDKIMTDDPESILRNADCVIVTQNTPEIRGLVATLTSGTTLIDLVRLPESPPIGTIYHGIGW